MQTEKRKEKKTFIQTEKRLEKKHYRIVIGLMILSIICYYFIEPKIAGQIIGHDIRYTLFIFWMPLVLGIIVLGVYRRKFLIHQFSTDKGFVSWTIMFLFYLVEGLFVAYLSLGQIAHVSWSVINKMTAEKNQTELIQCGVTKFWTKRIPSIEFKFQDRYESIKVANETIEEYKNKDPNHYSVEIEVQKGAWNHYIIKSWTIKEK